MTRWRWQLRRQRDGFLVDQAAELWVLLRAAYVQMDERSDVGRAHRLVHLPSETVVGVWRRHPGRPGGCAWEIDRELVRQLEPSERHL